MCGFSIGVDTPTWWTVYYKAMKNNKRTQILKKRKKKRETSQNIPGQSPQGEAYQPLISEA